MYTTQSNIESKLGTNLTDEQASYFSGVLDNMIDTFINNETETQFGSQTPTSIYVSGERSFMLTIPTMHEITEVKKLNSDGSDNVSLESGTDYLEYPRAGVDRYALRRLNGLWADGIENYKITGNLGYNDIPADIVHVATEIAINVLNESNNNYRSEKVGDWAVTYSDVSKSLSPESQTILASYRRLSEDI
jgi:hypothetical protein